MNKVGQISLGLKEKQGIQNYCDSMPLQSLTQWLVCAILEGLDFIGQK